MKLVIIPGAYSSHLSWSYFEEKISQSVEKVFLDYNPENSLEEIIINLEKKVSNIDDDIILIGHSLGGVIALTLSDRCSNIKSTITIAAPFGGVFLSRWMVFVSMLLTPFNSLWKNTHPDNVFLTSLHNKNLKTPTTAFIVETQNSTMWLEPSDGIVTVASQKSLGDLKNITYKYVYGTHADAMLNPDFIYTVNQLLL